MKEYAQLKLELAKEYYHNTCPICKKLFDEYHLPVFHHLWYEENDAKYNMFNNKHEYLQALSWYIVDNPKRFKCLCNDCHQSVTRIRYFKDDKLKRLLKIVRMTK